MLVQERDNTEDGAQGSQRRGTAQRSWNAALFCGGGGLSGIGVGASVVAAAGAYLIAVVLGDFDFDFVIAAVEGVVEGIVGDGILVAEFFANILERLIEIVDVVGEEGAAAGFFRNLL